MKMNTAFYCLPCKRFNLSIAFFIAVFCNVTLNTAYADPLPKDEKTANNEWMKDATVSNVTFYHKIVECSNQTTVLLKFENKNKYDVKISWKEVFTTQYGDGIEGARGLKELTLSKGVTMPSGCTDPVNKMNIVLPSDINPTYVADIQKFEFKNIAVTQTK